MSRADGSRRVWWGGVGRWHGQGCKILEGRMWRCPPRRGLGGVRSATIPNAGAATGVLGSVGGGAGGGSDLWEGGGQSCALAVGGCRRVRGDTHGWRRGVEGLVGAAECGPDRKERLRQQRCWGLQAGIRADLRENDRNAAQWRVLRGRPGARTETEDPPGEVRRQASQSSGGGVANQRGLRIGVVLGSAVGLGGWVWVRAGRDAVSGGGGRPAEELAWCRGVICCGRRRRTV